MSVHDFRFRPTKSGDTIGPRPEQAPIGPAELTQRPEAPRNTDIIEGTTNNVTKETEIRQINHKGLITMDRAIKDFFKDIHIPTKDDVREEMTVRIAGGDKSFLIWRQDLQEGRIQLPVMSINRTGFTFNAIKFTPPYHTRWRKFIDESGTRQILTYRPWPALITYECSIWAERKEHAEYALMEIIPRFDPLATVFIEDEYQEYTVVMKFTGYNDNSDVDIAADELAKVRYDMSIEMEGWLPRTQKKQPSILGRAATLNEITGEILDDFRISEV